MPDMSHWTQFWAAVIGVLSVARTARLIVWDEYPPTIWLREKWDRWTRKDQPDESPWNKLLHCQFCLTPYLAAVLLLWFWLGGDHWTWWVANGVWAGSYVAASVVAYDQPDE